MTPDIDGRVKDAIERETSEDDTHPGPLERFRRVRGIAAVSDATGSRLVWELFADRAALTAEMTGHIEALVRERRAAAL